MAVEISTNGVTANALNPGFIRSNLLRDMSGIQGLYRPIMRTLASPPEVGADRVVRLAASSEYDGVSGVYVSEDSITAPNPQARDLDVVRGLMSETARSLAPWMTPCVEPTP